MSPPAETTREERWRRSRSLFEAACDLPPGERDAWLVETCAGDARLLEEVRALLEADASATGALEPPPLPGGSRREASDRVGLALGAYVLEELIGSGGMGAVYRARRADDAFEKRVAVKLIKRGMDTDDILRRFRNERRLLAGMEHPCIARLLDGGTTEDGLPYLVMEHVDGVPLDRWCDEKRMEVGERLELFRRVCEAVDYAHRRGVVHRDLKPSNVLVDAEGTPKLLDFGIAKIVDAATSTGTVDLTATELRLMTPQYASPEQVLGEPVGPPSDVFSLGVVLYELLTGRPPHVARTRRRVDLEAAICEREPTRPSAAVLRPPTGHADASLEGVDPVRLAERRGCSPGRLRRRLLGDLDTVVLAALRKEPDRRYATAGALADDLGRLQAGLPLRARPDTWLYRASKFVRRNRWPVVAGVALLAVLLAGAVTSTILLLREQRALQEASQREYVARIASAMMAIEAHDVVQAKGELELVPRELRGWEWRHLLARTDRSERTLLDLGRVILRGLAVDPSGRFLAVGSNDRALRLFTLPLALEVARAEPGDGIGVCLDPMFLDGGERVVAVSERGGVHAWTVPSLEPMARTSGGRGYISLAGPDSGAWLAAGGTDGRIDLLEPRTLRVLRTLEGHGGPLRVAASHDGRRLASGGVDGRLLVHRVGDALPPETTIEVGGTIVSLAFSPDDALLAVSTSRAQAHEVLLYRVDTGGAVARTVAHSTDIRALLFHPDGGRLYTGALDDRIRAWSVPELRPLQVLLGHTSPVSDLVQDAGGSGLLSAGAIGRVRAWSWDTDDLSGWKGPPGWEMDLALSADGLVATCGAPVPGQGFEGGLEVRTLGGERLWSVSLPGASLRSLTLSPDARTLAAASLEGGLYLWDARSGAERGRRRVEDEGEPEQLRFTPDGNGLLLAVGSTIHLYDAATLQPRSRFDTEHDRVAAIATSPDGRRLAVCGYDGLATVRELSTGRILATLSGHERDVNAVAFHPTEELLATSSRDGTLRLWNPTDGTPPAVLEHLPGFARGYVEVHSFSNDVAFSLDGRRLASAGEDGTVRIWSVPDGRQVAVLRGHDRFVRRLTFQPGSSLLVSLSIDGTVRLWDAPQAD